MNELIYRQAAIDAANKIIERDTSGSNVVVNAMRAWSEYIRALPSVQPEIIRCKDCKHRGETPIADGRYWCDIHDTFMYYCSDAEGRTDG